MDIRNIKETPILPVKIHSGVLYKEVIAMNGVIDPLTKKPIKIKKALYIVEHVIDPSTFDMVIVYRVQDKSNPPAKAFDEIISETKYKPSTQLGLLANSIGIKKKNRKIQEVPPLFVTPVLMGVDTFTRQEGRGFFEREPDSFRGTGDIVEGSHTGVFISLNSVEWTHTFVPTSNILSDYGAIREAWFKISDGREV